VKETHLHETLDGRLDIRSRARRRRRNRNRGAQSQRPEGRKTGCLASSWLRTTNRTKRDRALHEVSLRQRRSGRVTVRNRNIPCARRNNTRRTNLGTGNLKERDIIFEKMAKASAGLKGPKGGEGAGRNQTKSEMTLTKETLSALVRKRTSRGLSVRCSKKGLGVRGGRPERGWLWKAGCWQGKQVRSCLPTEDRSERELQRKQKQTKQSEHSDASSKLKQRVPPYEINTLSPRNGQVTTGGGRKEKRGRPVHKKKVWSYVSGLKERKKKKGRTKGSFHRGGEES